MLVAAIAVLNLLNLNAQTVKLTAYDWTPATFPIHNLLVHWDGPCGLYTVKTNQDLNTPDWGTYTTVSKSQFLNSHLMAVLTLTGGPDQMFVKLDYTPDADQTGCQDTQLLIITQPVDQAVHTNMPTRFDAYTIGPDDRTHQWFKDGTPIIGATGATYGFEGTLPKDAATYHVEVSSPSQTLISNPAILTVIEDIVLPPVVNPVTNPSP